MLLFTATKFEVFLRVFQGKSFRAQSALKPELKGENNIAYCDVIAKQCNRAAMSARALWNAIFASYYHSSEGTVNSNNKKAPKKHPLQGA